MHSRRGPDIPAFAIIVGLLFLVIPFHLRPENFIVDDGYFYPQIAKFIAQGQGSTFNGIMPTNGYHPLWMLFCVAAACITQQPAPLLQLLSCVQDLMLAGTVLLLAASARADRLRGAWLGCLYILFFNTVLGIWRMLESPLAALLQMITLVVAVPCLPGLHERLGRYRLALLGACLGCVMLARLDLLFFAATILAFVFMQPGVPWERVRRTMIPGIIASLIVAPYLLWNWHSFHHLLPISGAIKSTFPDPQRWGLPLFTWPTLAGIGLNFTLLFYRRRTPFQTICVLSAVAAALHLAYTLSFGGLAPWYLTTGTLSTALALTWVLDWVLSHLSIGRIPERVFAVALVALFFAAGLVRSASNASFTRLRTGSVSLNGHYIEPRRALAMRLDAELPAGTRLFMFDAPGAVAFYSHMRIVPVDGLVADYRYNQELAQWGIAAYAKKHDIRYIVAPVVADGRAYDRLDMRAIRSVEGETVTLDTPLTHRSAGSFNLPDSSRLFSFRQINPDLATEFPQIAVWPVQP